jgi:hypothetical protein
MERGPLALFGAIIAVGLGPAMWLGAQFGHANGEPSRPPAVTVQQQDGVGGVGGAAPDDSTGVIRSDPKSNVEPLITQTPKPRKSSATPSASPSASPSESSPTASPSPSEEPTRPPTVTGAAARVPRHRRRPAPTTDRATASRRPSSRPD